MELKEAFQLEASVGIKELEDAVYELGLTHLNSRPFRSSTHRFVVFEKGMKILKRKFNGFLGYKTRTKEETLEIL